MTGPSARALLLEGGQRLTVSRRMRRASWPRLLTVTFRRSIQTGPVEKTVSRKSVSSVAVARWRRAEAARFAASSRLARRAASLDACRHWNPTHRPRLARGSAYRRQSAAKPVLFQTVTFVVSSFHAPRHGKQPVRELQYEPFRKSLEKLFRFAGVVDAAWEVSGTGFEFIPDRSATTCAGSRLS